MLFHVDVGAGAGILRLHYDRGDMPVSQQHQVREHVRISALVRPFWIPLKLHTHTHGHAKQKQITDNWS